ncbi:Zinc uptake regulation protein ZUR [Candidatus Rhodobacter oscarellae]|uniref:Zinc uptake regulation protein ZUR n=1 Tax=Candidatus Rhodobacter oscarellae TaxID=1675527 RepID=A0A0J9EBS9_9RHOB|nr:Fur family transcriptional regulator [Candidatus Rhodobacter lobularis]KMW60235.1 Zinc uptake regulation protein ZUR [Candidatus Rhodobacter lobularis]
MPEKNPHSRCGAGSNHPGAVEAALDLAEAQCQAQGLRMTPGRRNVLELLLREHRALGAYEILDLLRSKEDEMVKPPIAYRALDFLTKHGFAHKIERLSAFVACAHPGENHSPAFMICRKCRAVDEAHISLGQGALGAAARATGFQVERTMVEVEGICANCTSASAA